MRISARWIIVAVAATALPLIAVAQQPAKMARVGWVSVAGPEEGETSAFFDEFLRGLRDLGYIEGRNLIIEARWAHGDPNRLVDLAHDLVRLGVDVIVSQGVAIRGVRHAAGSVPVVFTLSADPVLMRLADNYSRPGGMFTGATFMAYEVNGKRLQLIKEALPEISRIAILGNSEHAGVSGELDESHKAAGALRLKLQYVPLASERDFDAAFATIAKGDAEAIVVLPDALVMQHRTRIIAFADTRKIPAISGWPAFARSGGLMTYGPNLKEAFYGIAHHVDQILNGAKPGELPVLRPARFELVVNLKTAKALGINMPATLLARADEVIE